MAIVKRIVHYEELYGDPDRLLSVWIDSDNDMHIDYSAPLDEESFNVIIYKDEFYDSIG